MKIFVVFGSKSDETVSLPLVEALKGDFEVDYEPISAHRELEKLQAKMNSWKGDAIVAGAGLAAALPGVVAAMTQLPVFGVPVPSQFGGLDAFASIAQMPPGVPVMTAGPASTAPIVSFLKQYKNWKKTKAVNFVSVVRPSDLVAEVEKAQALGQGITLSSEKNPDAFNIYIVTKAAEVREDELCLHVPFLPKSEAAEPGAYAAIVSLANAGGLWVGVNNMRNAVHAARRLA